LIASNRHTNKWVIWKTKTSGPPSTGNGLSPSPQHPQRHSRRLLGIQDSRMVTDRRHSGQEAQENLVLEGAQDSITTALLAPNHNFGKDGGVVDLTGHEARYWQRTESGLIGAFEFKGANTAGDGSCDAGSRSTGAGFCNLSLPG
jgi:hypothetical protein